MALIGDLLARLRMDTSGLDKGVNRANAKLNNFGKQSSSISSKISKSFGSLALGIGAAVGVSAVLAFNNARNSVVDFEQSIADLASVSGKSIKETENLAKSAKQIGSVSAFSASQVVSLQTSLAKLGFNEREIIASTRAIGDFSIAVGTDAASAAEFTGGVLRSFQKDATETEAVVGSLALATTKSALDFSKLEAGLSKIGPVGRAAGASLESITAKLGVLANNNIEARIAGTGLRNIYLELAKQGLTYDQAMNQITGSTNKLKTATELFGKENATVALVLADNTAQIAELEAGITDADGALKKMTDTRLDTVKGKTILLKSAWEGLTLAFDSGQGVLSRTSKGLLEFTTGILNASTAAVSGQISVGNFFKRIAGTLSGTTAGFALAASVDGTIKKVQELESNISNLSTDQLESNFQGLAAQLAEVYEQGGNVTSIKTLAELGKEINKVKNEITELENRNTSGIFESFKNAAREDSIGLLEKKLEKLNKQLDSVQYDTAIGKAKKYINSTIASRAEIEKETASLSALQNEINVLSYDELSNQRTAFTNLLAQEFKDKGLANALVDATAYIDTQIELKKETQSFGSTVGDTKKELTGFAAFLDGKLKDSLKIKELAEFEEKLIGISRASLNFATVASGISPVGILSFLEAADRSRITEKLAAPTREFVTILKSIPEEVITKYRIIQPDLQPTLAALDKIPGTQLIQVALQLNNNALDQFLSNQSGFRTAIELYPRLSDEFNTILKSIPEEVITKYRIIQPDLQPTLAALDKIPGTQFIQVALQLKNNALDQLTSQEGFRNPIEVTQSLSSKEQGGENYGNPLIAIAPQMQQQTDALIQQQLNYQAALANTQASLASIGLAMNAQGQATVSLSSALNEGSNAFVQYAEEGIKSVGDLARASLKAGFAVVKSLIRQGIAAAVANTLKGSSLFGLAAIPIAAAAGAAASSLFGSILPSPPKLAKGGIAIGQQTVTVGDNRSHREIILPIERLPEMLSKLLPNASGGPAESYIRNGHIFLAQKEAAVKYARRWG